MVLFRGGVKHGQKEGRSLTRTLESGHRIALRVARGGKESEFSGVVRSFDRPRGLISLEMEGRTKGKMSFFLGEEATIVGRTPDLNLDIPCVVAEESRFPILVCSRVNRRNHVRVNAFLQVKYRHVDRGLYKADPEGLLVRIREEMASHESSFEAIAEEEGEERLNPKFMGLLADMNRKLDRILAILDKELDGQREVAMAVNISGSGLRFTVQEKMEARKLLAIRIVLPLSPPLTVAFVGEVTRVRVKAKGEFEIAVKFVAIDEMDREQVVHYTFRRLRESLRNRNRKTAQK